MRSPAKPPAQFTIDKMMETIIRINKIENPIINPSSTIGPISFSTKDYMFKLKFGNILFITIKNASFTPVPDVATEGIRSTLS